MIPLFEQCAIAQFRPKLGDIGANCATLLRHYDALEQQGALLMVASECCITGYPAEDLLLSPAFIRHAMQALQHVAEYTAHKPLAMVVGCIWQEEGVLYNIAALLSEGIIQHIVKKHTLPNEGVFDEQRYFAAAHLPDPIMWRGHKIGLLVCKDMWEQSVIDHMAAHHVEAVISINASPYELGKDSKRKEKARYVAQHRHIPVLYVNQVGGQDELVFDGGSFMMESGGHEVRQAPMFEEYSGAVGAMQRAVAHDDDALHYQAMMCAVRDYVQHNGASTVLIGLSGGMDSALVATIAVDALGADHVHCVMMASPYTSDMSREDAQQLARTLGVRYDVVSITPSMQAIATTLDALCDPHIPSELAQENTQARLRGVLLMAISNSTGALLLTTGNKSELAMGYATLYGDMCGAFNPIKDLYKTDVYRIAHWRNDQSIHGIAAPIPQRIITRPPSAELRLHQQDEDSLPPYAWLDRVLHLLIEERKSPKDLIEMGYDAAQVTRTYQMMMRCEYKRTQAPIGVKLSSLAFGKDWRMPVTK